MIKKPLKRKRVKKSNSNKLNALKKTASMRGYKLVKKKGKGRTLNTRYAGKNSKGVYKYKTKVKK